MANTPTTSAAAATGPSPTPARRLLARPLPVLLLSLLLGVLAASLWQWQRPQAAPAVTFVSLSGEKIALQDLRGKVVMVHFWATSCAICVREMPAMVASYNKYHSRGLAFIAVAMAYDPPNYVLDYAQSRRLPFPVALDVNGMLARAFGDVAQTPTTFVIGKDGKIVQRYLGQPDFAQLQRVLENALAP